MRILSDVGVLKMLFKSLIEGGMLHCTTAKNIPQFDHLYNFIDNEEFIRNVKKIGFNIQNTAIVNFISSFFLGILVALNFSNNNLLLLFYVGFLGCFSTFSSFVYQLFNLFLKGKFQRLFFHYIEVVIFSFLFFYLGYFIIQYF